MIAFPPNPFPWQALLRLLALIALSWAGGTAAYFGAYAFNAPLARDALHTVAAGPTPVVKVIPANVAPSEYPVASLCESSEVRRTYPPDSLMPVQYTILNLPAQTITWNYPKPTALRTWYVNGQPSGEQVRVDDAAAACMIRKGGAP